jgi:integrase
LNHNNPLLDGRGSGKPSRLLRRSPDTIGHAVLHTGFWASELLSLTWQGVDFRRGVIIVQADYAKNGEAHSILMNNTLTMLLKSAKVDDAAAERVFGGRVSTPYRSYRNAFEHAVQAAGLEDCTFHDLCRTFASRLVMAGLDLPTVTELLGYKDISMTLRYCHLSHRHKQTAVEKRDKSPRSFHHTRQGDKKAVRVSAGNYSLEG